MSIRQIEKLYKNIIVKENTENGGGKIDSEIRSEIFQKILEDMDRLLKKLRKCKPDSKQFRDIDHEIRHLLLKEIQVIIDDYVLAKKNGTLDSWKNMYGNLNHYIHDFHMYRQGCFPGNMENILNKYGFYDQDDLT